MVTTRRHKRMSPPSLSSTKRFAAGQIKDQKAETNRQPYKAAQPGFDLTIPFGDDKRRICQPVRLFARIESSVRPSCSRRKCRCPLQFGHGVVHSHEPSHSAPSESFS